MNSLDQLAIQHGTDKSSLGHNYTPYYSMLFSQLRMRHVKLLEIGIDKGASLRMWSDYFWTLGVKIHGIDIEDKSCHEVPGKIYTHVVDQSDIDQLKRFSEEYNHYFDIVIDDGSHMSKDQLLTFEVMFPALRAGGLYVIEDLLCAYDARWNQGADIFGRIKQMVGETHMNGRIPNSCICANKQRWSQLSDTNYYEKNIEWIFCSCGLAVIKKMSYSL